ncbi:MAG: hypothetical protein WC222_06220 [Parachlamydiales bacterium]|jgi:hypothetical protein
MLEKYHNKIFVSIKCNLAWINSKKILFIALFLFNLTNLYPQFSINEKDELYLEYLIKNTSLGYSLCSKKPVSIYSSPKISKIHYIYQVHNLFKYPIHFLSSSERVTQQFGRMKASNKFKLFQVETINASHVILINYLSLKKELIKYKKIVEKITKVNVNHLIKEICTPEFWIKKQNQILLGIIFGYEYENALAFSSGIHKKQLFKVFDYDIIDDIYDIGFIVNSNETSVALLREKYQNMKNRIHNIFKSGKISENFLNIYYN